MVAVRISRIDSDAVPSVSIPATATSRPSIPALFTTEEGDRVEAAKRLILWRGECRIPVERGLAESEVGRIAFYDGDGKMGFDGGAGRGF